jgi:uncharacterized protein YjbI with pentapeptide repeats
VKKTFRYLCTIFTLGLPIAFILRRSRNTTALNGTHLSGQNVIIQTRESNTWVKEGLIFTVLFGIITGVITFAVQNHFDIQRENQTIRLENLRFVRENSLSENSRERPFQGLDLSEQILSGLSLSKSNFENAKLSRVSFIDTDLRDSVFKKSVARHSDFMYANLDNSDFSDADVGESKFLFAQLVDSDFSNANLKGADLFRADLRSADLSGANLNGARLFNADMTGADLRGTDLRGTDLENTTYSECTKTSGALYDETTLWPIGAKKDDECNFEDFFPPEDIGYSNMP